MHSISHLKEERLETAQTPCPSQSRVGPGFFWALDDVHKIIPTFLPKARIGHGNRRTSPLQPPHSPKNTSLRMSLSMAGYSGLISSGW